MGAERGLGLGLTLLIPILEASALGGASHLGGVCSGWCFLGSLSASHFDCGWVLLDGLLPEGPVGFMLCLRKHVGLEHLWVCGLGRKC